MSSLELSSKMHKGACINLLAVTLVMCLTLVKWNLLISKGSFFFFISYANVITRMQSTSPVLRA